MWSGDDWEEILDAATLVGAAADGGSITIVEFVDLECPFCRQSHIALADVKRALADSVWHYVVHYPMEDIHRFAMPAARAVECAGHEGRFTDYLELVFEKQDSLGLKTWASYAVESGVQDTIRFNECNSGKGPVPRVEQGLRIGSEIDVRMTPTVLINGWLLGNAPRDAEEYLRAINEIIAGEGPYVR